MFVLSDLDGVLADSVASSQRAWAAWGARHGIDGVALQAANQGRPAWEVIAEVIAPSRVEEEAAFIHRAEVAAAGSLTAFPGAREVLALPRVAVVTSCDHVLALACMAGAGLEVPEILVTSDMVRAGKPAPDAFLLAAARLGADPADCVVLEDAPAGVAAGRAAGMTVWAVTTTHPAADLRDAHRVASGLPELMTGLRAAA